MKARSLLKKARPLPVIVAAAVLLALCSQCRRAKVLREVIFDYEAATGYSKAAPDSSVCVRSIGRSDTQYYYLPRVPKYRHFWGCKRK